MSRNETELRQPRTAEGLEMIALMRKGVVQALSEHKRSGRSVIVWDYKRQQIVEIPADEIKMPETEV